MALLYLGSIPYMVKSSKSCIQGKENEPQSHWGEAETIVREGLQGITESWSATWPSQSHLAVCVHTMWSDFSEYEATFGNFFYYKYLEYVSEILWNYCLDTCLCKCKRICLNVYYLSLILMFKFRKNIGLAVPKNKVKNTKILTE